MTASSLDRDRSRAHLSASHCMALIVSTSYPCALPPAFEPKTLSGAWCSQSSAPSLTVPSFFSPVSAMMHRIRFFCLCVCVSLSLSLYVCVSVCLLALQVGSSGNLPVLFLVLLSHFLFSPFSYFSLTFRPPLHMYQRLLSASVRSPAPRSCCSHSRGSLLSLAAAWTLAQTVPCTQG